MFSIAQESNRTTAHAEASGYLSHASALREQSKGVPGRRVCQLVAAVSLALHARASSMADAQVVNAAVARIVVPEQHRPSPGIPEERLRYEPMDKHRPVLAIQAQFDDTPQAGLRRLEYATDPGAVIVLYPPHPPARTDLVPPDRPWTRCPPFQWYSHRHGRSVPRK